MKLNNTVFSIVCFLILVGNAPSYGQLFAPAVNYGVGLHPWSVFAADLDGDGDNDLAVANEWSNSVSILMNDGEATFPDTVNYMVGNWPVSVFASDLDGDNDLDLTVANHHSYCVTILKNNGYGIFQVDSQPSVEYYAYSVVAKDLDGDGDSDLAVTTAYSGVAILKNNGDGTFQGAVYYAVGGTHLITLSACDLDGDGDNDLAVSVSSSNNVSILRNNGDGIFQTAVNYGVGGRPYSVFAADLDGDGDNDLAVANQLSDNVSILKNNSDGTFQSAVNYSAGGEPTSVFACDLDCDGDNDLAVANNDSNSVSILKNNGDGTFQAAVNYGVGNEPISVFASDLDDDDDLDLAVANWGSSNVSVLFNLSVHIGSICASVNLSDGSPAQGVTVTVLDENNDPVADPVQTEINGEAYFGELPVGDYSVMIVTPLGYSVSPSETQTSINVTSGDCTQVDFVLTPIIVSNNCRTIGYWKHQFNVYTSNRGNAQESAADLETCINLVHQHFNVLGVYVDLENFDFEDAKNVLTVRGGSLMLDRAKQQLFALLLNFASGRIGNETVVSDDGRVAAEAVTLVADLITDTNPANDEMAKTVCDLINNGQMVESGIIPESSVRYKQTDDYESLPKNFSISQNYPNPFNASTVIQYTLPTSSDVMLDIYDILGRKVETLVNKQQQSGYHQVIWNADGISTGIYFYKLQAGEYSESKKMLLLK